MCGISGYLDLEHGVDAPLLRQMTDVIRHRGPDDEGYALVDENGVHSYGGPDTMPDLQLPRLEPGTGAGAFLGFGHRRLSILDLSAGGHQPMCLPERDIVLTYNGELYNYLELKAKLESMGYAFQTGSDTEVLLYAYCAWGEDCLTHFNGMWAFVLWDGQENKLFCARDRLGAKPFHYYHRDNYFVFGSELKQLCGGAVRQRRFHLPYLAANLLYHISDYNDETLIEGIRTLRPAHKLVMRLNGMRTKIESCQVMPYWTLRVFYDYGKSEQAWCEAVAEEFSRACRWRMRSDAPVGALLSGGLDSSCMVTELCSQLSDPSQLRTFTTSYPGERMCDEWEYANRINQWCGCTGTQVIPQPSHLEDRFEELIWHIEGLGGLALLGVKFLLDEIARQGYKVLLNGQCGDELMLGYERYYAYYFMALLKRGQGKTFLSELSLSSKHSKWNLRQLLQFSCYFNNPVVRDNRQLLRARRFVSSDLLEQRDRRELRKLLYPHTLEELQYNELTATQLPHIVRFDDRLYMSASMESRIPFMDYQLAELICSIPPQYKMKNGYTKYLLRKVFDSRMPEAVTWRTNKMGFEAPTESWAGAFSRDYLMDNITQARTAAYFKTDALVSMADANRADPSLYEFLAMELFARKFGVT